ncbi:MAG: hypothetical protein K2K70_13595 [Lachnospiraceae bacterium]|nr:hypothetical protein [Lachnospiraceae bacterium]
MITDGGVNAFGLSIALTNKTEIANSEMDLEEEEKVLKEEKKDKLQQEVNLMVNQIGKINQPLG